MNLKPKWSIWELDARRGPIYGTQEKKRRKKKEKGKRLIVNYD